MSGKRINDSGIGFHTGFEPELVFAVDRVDTGTGDWLQMRKLTLADIGNTYIQGSTNGINWHDEVTSSDSYLRITTDGANNWISLDTDLISEGTNLYFTEARVLGTTGVQTAVDDAHIHPNKALLDNLIDNGSGNNYLSDDGTYKNIITVSHAGQHIDGGADPIDADKLEISWTPSNYTPAITPTEVDAVDQLTAHLYGVDQILSWIDQDLTTTATPTWAGYNLTPTTVPAHSEGRIWYDSAKHGITYFSDVTDVQVNMGQEVLFRVTNNTGSLIPNGTVVYPDPSTVIGLADAQFKSKSRVVAVATHDIANGTEGWVTKFGQVGGLDTSMYSVGQTLYLGNNGQMTDAIPFDGGYEVVVAVVDVVDASNGIITVDPNSSLLTVEVTDTNGFPTDQVTGTTLSFDNGTRTFTIAPTGSGFHYYQTGDKYEKVSSESVIIPDTTGEHIIYFDEETLTSIANPSSSQVEDVVRNKCFVSYLYWNSTQAASVIVNDERHGISMSPATHVYLHTTRGAQYLSGLAISGITLGAGSSNSHAQFGTELGTITDEDLPHNLVAVASTTGLKYLYRTGAGGEWNSGTNPGYSFPVGGTPLPQYNEYTGATWQLTEVPSGDYFLLHIFATSDIDLKPIAVLGTNTYLTVSAASAGVSNEISGILGTLAAPEFVPIATIIFEAKTSFTNSVNARIVQNTDGDNYTDWRTTELAQGTPASNHNTLTNLQLANTGITWGHIDNQTQSIYGAKTFDSAVSSNTIASTTNHLVRLGQLEDASLDVDFNSLAVNGTPVLFSETDPIVGAINGIVKADGSGNISAAVAGTDYQSPLTFGISTGDKVQIDSTTVVDNDYAKFTVNGLEGRSYSEVASDIGSSIATVGTIGTGVWQGTAIADTYVANATDYKTQVVSIAVSDETTALTAGTAKATFRMPFAMTLSEVRASVTTAPVGSTIQVDINESGVSILSTVISIDVGEKTSETAATAPVISDSVLADDAEVTIDIDQVGSSTAGAGLKIYLIGTI